MSGKDFDSYIENSEYLKIYSLAFDKERMMFIESDRDRVFWEDFLHSHGVSDKYKITTGSQEKPLARGKAIFSLKAFKNATKDLVYAIDSDFDYIAPKRSDIAVAINENPYVLQTYAYSIENIKFQADCLNTSVGKIKYSVRHNYLFNDFIERYSKIIFPFLSRYFYLLNKRNAVVDEREFHKRIIPDKSCLLRAYFDNDWSPLECAISNVEEVFGTDLLGDDYNLFVKYLSESGLNEANSYMYISGHGYFEGIVKPIVNEISIRVAKKARMAVPNKQDIGDKEYGGRMREVTNFFRENCKIDTILDSCEEFKHTSIYKKISRDVSAII